MKNRSILFLVIILAVFGQNSFAQKSYSPEDRDKIADNATELINDFFNTLSFDNALDKSTVDNYFRNYGDSLAFIKLDSLKQNVRGKTAAQIKKYFLTTKKGEGSRVTNFAFDNELGLQPDDFTADEFVEKFVTYYDRVVKGEGQNLFIDQKKGYQEKLRPIMRNLLILDESGGSSVIVSLEVGQLSFYYDTIAYNLGKTVSAEKKISENYELKNYQLAFQVFFKNPGDVRSFSIMGLSKFGEIEPAFVMDDMKAKIESDIIQNFKLYADISEEDKAPDPELAESFINMFNNPDNKSIQCDLFFKEICGNATDISVREYVDIVMQNYDLVYPVEVRANFDSLELIERTSIDYVIKLPVEYEFKADKINGENSPDILEKTYFYIRVTYSKSLLSGKEELLQARLTDITSFDKKPTVFRGQKKGNWAISANYQPGMLINQPEGDFAAYKSEFSLSNGFGINGQYFWFVKKNGVIIHDASYGLSLGVYVENYTSKMKFDNFYYDDIIPGSTEGQAFYDLDFADTVLIGLEGYQQELSYSAISIPVQGHYNTWFKSKKAFYTLAAGLSFTLPGVSSVKVSQTKGFADYKGIKKIDNFPGNEEGTYLLEQLPSKGFSGYQAVISEDTEKINASIIYLTFNPSISFSINNTIEHGFIDLGINFRYGLNSLYSISEKQEYLVDSYGKSHSVFANGLKSNHLFLGLSIGFRYLNEKQDKSYKKIQ